MKVEHLDALPELDQKLILHLLESGHVLPSLLYGISTALPDSSIWRVTLSGDLRKSVNGLESRNGLLPYTTVRGAGEVGARTIKQDDSTFDLVFSARAFLHPQQQVTTLEELAEHADAVGLHLGLHEASHVVLHLRTEDANSFQEGARGDLSERAWRQHLSAHIDDFRIERSARAEAPSPYCQADHLPDALNHLRSVLNESFVECRTDLEGSVLRSMTAANSLLLVLAYYAAEVDEQGSLGTLRPDALPEGWARYVEPIWARWTEILYRLPSSKEPTPRALLEDALTELCALVTLWLEWIGLNWELLDEDGRASCFWTKYPY